MLIQQGPVVHSIIADAAGKLLPVKLNSAIYTSKYTVKRLKFVASKFCCFDATNIFVASFFRGLGVPKDNIMGILIFVAF